MSRHIFNSVLTLGLLVIVSLALLSDAQRLLRPKPQNDDAVTKRPDNNKNDDFSVTQYGKEGKDKQTKTTHGKTQEGASTESPAVKQTKDVVERAKELTDTNVHGSQANTTVVVADEKALQRANQVVAELAAEKNNSNIIYHRRTDTNVEVHSHGKQKSVDITNRATEKIHMSNGEYQAMELLNKVDNNTNGTNITGGAMELFNEPESANANGIYKIFLLSLFSLLVSMVLV